MAGRKSPKPPAQPRMVQKRTGSAGPAKAPLPSRGKNTKADVNEHTTAKPGQQAPKGPTKPGPNTPYPAKGRRQSSAPARAAREGVKDQAGKLFGNAEARNEKLSRRNRNSV